MTQFDLKMIANTRIRFRYRFSQYQSLLVDETCANHTIQTRLMNERQKKQSKYAKGWINCSKQAKNSFKNWRNSQSIWKRPEPMTFMVSPTIHGGAVPDDHTGMFLVLWRCWWCPPIGVSMPARVGSKSEKEKYELWCKQSTNIEKIWREARCESWCPGLNLTAQESFKVWILMLGLWSKGPY